MTNAEGGKVRPALTLKFRRIHAALIISQAFVHPYSHNASAHTDAFLMIQRPSRAYNTQIHR